MSRFVVRAGLYRVDLLANPVWPVLTLAFIQLVDAVLCFKPVPFVRQCLDDVHCPPRVRRLLTPLKLAAALGLLAGLVVPFLGMVTCLALVAYFLIAVGLHLRFRDLRLNFVNATGLAVGCAAVTACFV
ncbi:MAG: DoxX family protein [Propionibacteriaceae bacterium]